MYVPCGGSGFLVFGITSYATPFLLNWVDTVQPTIVEKVYHALQLLDPLYYSGSISDRVVFLDDS